MTRTIAWIPALLCLTAAAQPAAEWKTLFDGKSMEGWKETQFARHGGVKLENGTMVLGLGQPLTGVNLTTPFPKIDYEIRFEAMRIRGGDFFASLTIPVGSSFGTFVTGGWGGDIVGFSSIDNWDASDNETRSYFTFENGRWYTFKLQVTAQRIVGSIDDQVVFNPVITGRTISLRPGEISLSTPFGFASYNTVGAIRKVEYRLLRPPSGDRGKQ
ncbi:DUF1080 domain-containing protein [uncultured Paludibaculum sp.]|uniref:3-keto-disaccharide hydrolase n=1 Tax=uncultured Paludibaculum sp. TaxID=1765020 RepID=UPI002AAB944D|nr:DUF1080 domain-containing protein [uncultured Paludibaculum sp.]